MGETMSNFITWKEAYKKESQDRLDTDIKKLCKYGIKPLDDSLICINKGELVVIGADSGVGKSEIAINISRHNAMAGKKVALYHLEGGYREAVSRIKWKDITREYFANHTGMGIDMDFRKWSVNFEQDKILTDIEAEVYEHYKDKCMENLYFYDSPDDLTITDFLASLLDFHDLKTAGGNFYSGDQRSAGFDLDLIVIDHLQYFSLDQGENEIQEITNIIRQVKKVTDKYKIPVVLISHLRKKMKDRGLPDQQDFYGSSNIPKIATTAITLTPKINSEDFRNQIYPTWVRVVKSRIGIKPSIAMLIDFNSRSKEYSDKYELYKVNSEGHTSKEPMMETDVPKWAYGSIKTGGVEHEPINNWQDR